MPPVFVSMALSALLEWDDAARGVWNKFALHVASKQQEDGSFVTGIGRPPIFDRPEVMTAYAALILSPPERERAGLQDVAALRAKTMQWLDRTPASGSHQGLVMRLLAETRAAGTTETAQKLVSAVLERQDAGGGWRQTADLPADAHATGQALYALRSAGVPADNAALQRGVAFLVKTQSPEGTWPMTSRPVLDNPPAEEKPASERTEFQVPITYAGTAWATLGLVRCVPRQ